MRVPSRTLPLLLLPVVLLGGCSAEVSIGGTGPDALTQAQLEESVTGNITGADAERAEVSCEGDLASEVEATQDCQVTLAGESTGVRLVVTEVVGDEVEFDQVLFIAADELAAAVDRFYSEQGIAVTSTSCEGELIGEAGESATCDVTSSSDGDARVEATTTTVDGLVVNFDLEVLS